MKFFQFLKKKSVIFTAILALIVVIFVVSRGGAERETVTVQRKDVVEAVVATGKTKARNEVSLGFDTNGRVARSLVKVGDKVARGALLAELDTEEASANIAREQGILSEEQAKFNESSKDIYLAILDGYSTSDNAIRNKIDQFFKTPRTNPVFEVKFADGNFVHYFNVPQDTLTDLNVSRSQIEILLMKWQSEVSKITEVNAGEFTESSIANMNTISRFLDKIAFAVNSFTPAEFAYEATVTGYKTSVDTARSTVAAAKEKISSSSAQKARITQINSSIVSLQASLSKSRIVSPFAGTVTKQDAKVGEAVRSGDALISVVSESDMYVEANVSEINIGKIKVGDPVKVEFDAFRGEVINGSVSFIDPAETIINEVVNYKIRIELEQVAPNIPPVKSGLTANLSIVSNLKPQVLAVPIYALKKENEKYFADKLVDGKIVRTEVQIGTIGGDGLSEVVSGLAEGDSIAF